MDLYDWLNKFYRFYMAAALNILSRCDLMLMHIVETSLIRGLTGIQGKQEQEWDRKTGMGTCNNCCYLSDSLPVKFIELCEPSYKYSIVFRSRNKCRPAQNSILTDAICDLL